MQYRSWLGAIAALALAATAFAKSEEPVQLHRRPALDDGVFKQVSEAGQKFEFQAQVTRLLGLLANSIYENEETFIRELIANSCDALDKVRLQSLQNAADAGGLDELAKLKVIVEVDKEKGVFSVTDNGIGMTHDELKDFLGTIARSGTSETAGKLEEGKGPLFIGQFGVGFYSVLLVADQVAVISKSDADAKQWIWESDTTASFRIAEDPRGNTLKRGTQVVLKLKPKASKYLDEKVAEDIVKKFFVHDRHAIYLVKHKTEYDEVPLEEAEAKTESPEEKKDESKPKDDVEVEDEDEIKEEKKKDDAKPKTKKVEKIVEEEALISQSQEPMWRRSEKDISPEERKVFFKKFFDEHQEPLKFKQYSSKGDSVADYHSILLIPKRPPFSPFNTKEIKSHIKLHVRGVFVTAKLDDFLPRYLSFVKGIIDSDDLPLNISRDTLQNNDALKMIQKKTVQKTLEMIEELSEDPVLFKEFYEAYSSHLKLEIIDSERYRNRIAKMLRFKSSKSKGELISFADYVRDKKEKQKSIYYLAGPGMAELEKSPFLEKLRKFGYDVLFMTDPVDEHMIQAIREFEDLKLQNIAKDGLKLDDDEVDETAVKALEEEYKPLLEWMKSSLADDVESVVLSKRLTESPCAVVASEYGWTGNMERVIMAQSSVKDDPYLSFFANQKKIFEINPDNLIIKELLSRVKSGKADADLKNFVKVLFDSTLVWSGYTLKDTAKFADNVSRLIAKLLGITLPEPAKPAKPAKDQIEEPVESDALNIEDLMKTMKDAKVDEPKSEPVAKAKEETMLEDDSMDREEL